MYYLNKRYRYFISYYIKYLRRMNSTKVDVSFAKDVHDDVVAMNNSSSSAYSTFQATSTHILTITLLSFILFIGVTGNLLVVYIFGVKPAKKQHTKSKRFDVLLSILGFVDFLSSFFIPASFIYLTTTNYQQWHFGHVGCKIIPSLVQVSISISQCVLVLISYERYQAISHPFERSRLTIPKLCAFVVVSITLSILLAIPYSMTLDLVQSKKFNVNTCLPRSDSVELQLASSCIYLGRDLIAVAIMFCLYVKMNRQLTKKHITLTWNRAAFSQKGRRLLKTVLIVFVVLTLPFDIYQVSVLSIFVTKDTEITRQHYGHLVVANTLLKILQISNSVSNIFIYARLHSNFKQHVKCWRQKPSDNDSDVGTRLSALSDNVHMTLKMPGVSDNGIGVLL